MAFIRPPEVEGGEQATASVAYGWESEMGAVSEVLAELVLCTMPVRSTQIGGAVTRADDMECYYVLVEYSLVVASIFSFRTMGQWEH